MEHLEYKVVLKMGWEFVVNAASRENAIEKVNKKLDELFAQDGYSFHVSNARDNIASNDYTIEEYTVFVIR